MHRRAFDPSFSSRLPEWWLALRTVLCTLDDRTDHKRVPKDRWLEWVL